MQTPEIFSASEIPKGAVAEQATVHAQTTTRLEALKQSIAPKILPALTIAGITYITYLGIKAILTGKNPLEK